MKKKLLVLLLIIAIAAFVFTGCTPGGEGEGEGEGEIEGVIVEIDGAVEIGGRTYVSGSSHDITVTFPAPVANANVFISDCSGNYAKAAPFSYYDYGTPVVLWPNEDKTVWTGKGSFVCKPCGKDSTECEKYYDCCASYVSVVAGECEGNVCISLPVIVDCDLPYACIEVSIDECVCEGCEVTFKSTKTSPECAAGKQCCGDNCSGLASWAIAIYNKNPFDKCCETTCYEPIWSASDTECPIDVATNCLTAGIATPTPYWVIVSLVDMVGNEVEYYAKLYISNEGTEEAPICNLVVENYCADKLGCTCTSWLSSALITDTSCATITGKVKGAIGSCSPANNCCPNQTAP